MVTEGFKRLLQKWSSYSFGNSEDTHSLKPALSTPPLSPADSPPESPPLSRPRARTPTPTPPSKQEDSRPRSPSPTPDPTPSTDSPLSIMLKVAKKGLQLLAFTILRYLMLCFFAVYHALDGTWADARRSRRPENYSCSARVYRVMLQHKYDYLVNMNSLSDFILIHEGFTDPHDVMAEEVSLYEVNDHEAVFVQAPPGVEVWRHRYDAFHIVAQTQHAYKVISMPLASFYRLAEEVGDPSGKLVFITNTARCGSTLLSRIFEETDAFATFSEPATINTLRKFVGAAESSQHAHDQTKAIVRMLCKSPNFKNFAIKITPTSSKIVPLIQRVYPDAAQLFIYRDGLPVSRSMFKIWLELPMGYLNIMFVKYFHWFYAKALNWADYYDSYDIIGAGLRLAPGYGQGCYMWGNIINMYRRFRREGIRIAAVKYEDLVSDKQGSLEKLFQYCDVPTSLVKPALRAFDIDSQKNSILSRKILRRCVLPEFSAEIKRETDKICDFFDLAHLGDSCVIEGTLTRKESLSQS